MYLICIYTVSKFCSFKKYLFRYEQCKAALAVILSFFSSPKLTFMTKKQFKPVFGNLFHLERNKYCFDIYDKY